MNVIENFINPLDANFVQWTFNGKTIRKESSGRIYAIRTPMNLIVVVDISKRHGADNAFIYEADGKEKARVVNPLKDEGYICFDDVYLVNNDVTLICGGRSGRKACIIDQTGNVIKIYETR